MSSPVRVANVAATFTPKFPSNTPPFRNTKGTQLNLNLNVGGNNPNTGSAFHRGVRDTFYQNDPVFVQWAKGNVRVGQEPGWTDKIAYLAGNVAGDYQGDKTRNFVWRNNHPLAVTQGVSRYAANQSRLSPWESGLATLAGVSTMTITSGNTDLRNWQEGGRPMGHKAVYPSYDDPTESRRPLLEMPSRYFLGRTGRVLGEEDFFRERPDISPQEYQQYKDYQNQWALIKATPDDGIRGPVATMMGFDVPLTGAMQTAGVMGGIGLASRTQPIKPISQIQNPTTMQRVNHQFRHRPSRLAMGGLAGLAVGKLASLPLEDI